jgi:hypothetical protein
VPRQLPFLLRPTEVAMKRILFALMTLLILQLAPLPADDKPAQRSAKEALKPFNELIGSWKATATPSGRAKEFWQETVAWEWQFKGDDAWIKLTFTKGKNFEKGTLRYLPDRDAYRLRLVTNDKQTLDFDGKFNAEKRTLTVDRTDPTTKDTQQFVVTMLHETRFLYRYEVKPDGRTGFTPQFKAGATREGIAFAAGDAKPECVVSGGLGTMKVTYKGKEYYVCCGGCRDAFNDNPEKFVKEFEARKKGQK